MNHGKTRRRESKIRELFENLRGIFCACQAKICSGAARVAQKTLSMLLREGKANNVHAQTQNGPENERGVPSTVCSMSKNRIGDPMIKYHTLPIVHRGLSSSEGPSPNLCDRGNRCHDRGHADFTVCCLLGAITGDYT